MRHRRIICEQALPIVLALVAGSGCAATRALTVDRDGKTVYVAPVVPAKRKVAFETRQPSIALCGHEFELTDVKVRYVLKPAIIAPTLLTDSESEESEADKKQPDLQVTKSAIGDGFLVYNIFTKATTETAATQTCSDAITGESVKLTKIKDDLQSLAEDLAKKAAALKLLNERLLSEQKDLAAFSGIAGAADRLAEAMNRVAATRVLALAAAEAVTIAQVAYDAKKEELDDFPAAARRSLGVPLERAEYLLAGLRGGFVLKIGGLPIGKTFKSIYYDFASIPSGSTLQLMPLGAYPVVLFGDSISAAVVNVNPIAHPHPFALSVTSAPGEAINIEPARPVFEVSGESARAQVRSEASAQAYRDVFLPIRDFMAPNSIPTITIGTERRDADDPKKLVPVLLVDKVKLPQVRALYRYNFNSGVLYSSLRQDTFTKVRTKDDDPATKEVDESEFRIHKETQDERVFPVAAFTYYLRPVDIQAPVRWWDRIWPHPTIGFGLTDPTEDFLVGASFELLRNAQLLVAKHWGVQHELLVRNDISEEADGTAPLTSDRRVSGWSAGLTFNLAVISKIFK